MGPAFKTIVVATDFPPHAERAWALARWLAEPLGAELVLVHVLVADDMLRSLEPVERRAEERGRVAAHQLNVPRTPEAPDHGVTAQAWAESKLAQWSVAGSAALKVRTLVRAGSAPREIVAIAKEEHADLVVPGTHGLGEVERLLVGSVADRVVRTAPCPVLTVR